MASDSSTVAWRSTWLVKPISVGIMLSTLAASMSGAASHRFYRRDEQDVNTFGAHNIEPRFDDALHVHSEECRLDRSQPPVLEELVACRNSSMFSVWRPKARFIGPRGWMNDPMGIFRIKNGNYHIGYQCNPNHLVWANISQCSASTSDFVRFNDYGSWQNPITIAPSQLYDIRGVFDGTVIQDGWNGNPSIIYTSTFPGPLGAHSNPPEIEGVETQSIAYTQDDGQTWTKLNFGANGNPVIYYWPEQHLTGFRDPFVFESPALLNFYANTSVDHKIPGNSNGLKPTGKKFLLLSGGIRVQADPINGGPRIFLYRQTQENDIRDWAYLGAILSFPAQYNQTSEWTGARGINFECGGLAEINEHGRVTENSSSSESTRLNIFTMGTEGAHNSTHMDDWAIWQAASYDYSSSDGNVKAKVDFSGIIDWGRAYAFFTFPSGTRQLIVGWAYEDDELNVLTRQRGAQGAFTLFREMFVKVIRNVHANALRSAENAPSWTVRSERDGTQSVITVGQKILPEIMAEYKKSSTVSLLKDQTLNPGSSPDPHLQGHMSTRLVKFDRQPEDRYYVISAQLDFFASQEAVTNGRINESGAVRGGFRIRASEQEWTDVYYDPSREYLVIDRSKSSAISAYGKSTELAKHRLWPILDPVTKQTSIESLNLTIVVDNSVLEVHANERSIITTRVYPWYNNSIGVHYLVQGPQSVVDNFQSPNSIDTSNEDQTPSRRNAKHNQPGSVHFSNVELWDGLLNAWPNRPRDTSLPGTYSNNITSSLYGVWPDL